MVARWRHCARRRVADWEWKKLAQCASKNKQYSKIPVSSGAAAKHPVLFRRQEFFSDAHPEKHVGTWQKDATKGNRRSSLLDHFGRDHVRGAGLVERQSGS